MPRRFLSLGLLALASCVAITSSEEAGPGGGGDPCAGGACEETCGNGKLDPGEPCDGTAPGSGPCHEGCVLPACGDGIVDPGEECDDGNLANVDGCSQTCLVECLRFVELDALWVTVIGRTEDGRLYSWGSHQHGMLGRPFPPPEHGESYDQVPMPIEGLPPIAEVQGGALGAMARDESGGTWVWGYDETGLLGFAGPEPIPAPVRQPAFDRFPVVAIGRLTTLLLDEAGALWGLGSNTAPHGGLLGAGVPGGPEPVLLDEGPFDAVVMTRGSAFARRPDGTLVAWGRNVDGTVGPWVPPGASVPAFQEVPLPGRVVDFDALDRVIVALLEDGRVFAWGDDIHGDMAAAAGTPPDEPAPAPLPDGVVPVAVRASSRAVYVLDDRGRVFSFGLTEWGGLGREPATKDPVTAYYSPPEEIALPPGVVVEEVLPGFQHFFLRSTSGDLVAGDHREGVYARPIYDWETPQPVPQRLCAIPLRPEG